MRATGVGSDKSSHASRSLIEEPIKMRRECVLQNAANTILVFCAQALTSWNFLILASVGFVAIIN